MSKRTRNFATIVYPESAPEDWIEILELECVPCFISPLHNLDVESTGEVKKPHYHVMIMFSNVKTAVQAQEIFSKINGVGIIAINDIRGMARYFCHLDSYNKKKYNPDDVIQLSGANYYDIISISTDRTSALMDMIVWCTENNVIYFSELTRHAMVHNQAWFNVLATSGAIFMKEYLKSLQYEKRNN